MCAKAFSPEPRGDCRMVKHSTLPLSQQRDPCRRLWAWKCCQPATLHPRQKMQSMQGIQPPERGSLLSPTALCPQILRVLVLFVSSTIIRRHLFRRWRQHQPTLKSHTPPRPPLSERLTSEQARGGRGARRESRGSNLPRPPGTAQAQPAQPSACRATWQHRIGLLSTGASSPPTQNSI